MNIAINYCYQPKTSLGINVKPSKHFAILLVFFVSLTSGDLWAKPKLGISGSCKMSTACANNSEWATCAQLYCKALRADCRGVYSSGECYDIKVLYYAAGCGSATVPSECGGLGLPKKPIEVLPKAPEELQKLSPEAPEERIDDKRKMPSTDSKKRTD